MGPAFALFLASLLSDPAGPPPDMATPGRLQAGETRWLAGDLAGARRELLGFEPEGELDRARRARLLFELAVAQGDRREAERWALGLSGNTGWEQELATGWRRLEAAERQRTWARAGIFAFALALGILLLGGGRELLRPGRGAWVMGIGGALGWTLVQAQDPLLGLRLGMSVIAATALVHAGESALLRQLAGPKWRLLIATTVLLGTAGAVLAAFVRVAPGQN